MRIDRNTKYGHNTDGCVIANNLLECLAREGHLNKYIAGHISKNDKGSSSNTDKGKKVIGTTPRSEIHYISGGFAGGGPNNSARKRSYRAMLSVEGSEFRPQAQHKEIPQITFK
ncbi:hypothetical protein PIB30_053426 [Stylosanthes scabra]|uniref:Uncharacterized protein n=1 Tax=Stylosanthes scabra TaxID=79078 RepID=A0ABU6ZHA2_9FABA|nr:hypothetical protein [Stylosanthes scabra]